MISHDYKQHNIDLVSIAFENQSPDGVLERFDEIDKLYGNCQACWGKGYQTKSDHKQVTFCDCTRGHSLKRLWKKPVC